MCANHHPVAARDRLLYYFGVHRPGSDPPPEMAFALSIAPFIVRAQDHVEIERDLRLGQFGLLPFWAKEVAFGRKTYNAGNEYLH
jgi:putative SOS response-associated peptidase YedK